MVASPGTPVRRKGFKPVGLVEASATPAPTIVGSAELSSVDVSSDTPIRIETTVPVNPFDWLPCLAVFAVWLIAFVASSAEGYRCAVEQGEQVSFFEWVLESVTWFAFQPQSAAIAGWCLGYRRRFGDSWLHVWTWRYGLLSAAMAAVCSPLPWMFEHRSGALRHAARVVGMLAMLAWLLCKFLTLILLELKLRSMGRPRLAQILRCCCFIALLFGVATVVLQRIDMSSRSPVQRVCWWVGAAAFLGMYGAGIWGLMAAPLRAACSPNTQMKRASAWVALTAVATATACVTTMLLVNSWRQVSSEREPGDRLVVPVSIVFVFLADGIFDCSCVILFSGLVGPREVRRVAEVAFAAINSYTEVQLQECYEKYLRFLDEADVKWIRVRFLRHLIAEGRIMPRCQEVPASELVVGCDGFPERRSEPKHRWVFSHPWLAKYHPDPHGIKLKIMVQQLESLSAEEDDCIFLDYMSIPQHKKEEWDAELWSLDRQGNFPEPGSHPAIRSREEEESFRKALSSMETLYSVGGTPVVVLPMEGQVTEGSEYLSRGWCFLEFCLALSFGNLANAQISPSVEKLSRDVITRKANTVQGFRRAFEKTHFTKSGDTKLVLRLFEQTLRKAS